MEETIYGQGINMADIWMREQPSHASLRSQASAATHQTNTSTMPFKDLENAKAGASIDKRSQMVHLDGWTFYALTFASVLPCGIVKDVSV